MAQIPARRQFLPKGLSTEYNRTELHQQFGLVAQAIPPQITRSIVAATTLQTTDGTIVADTTSSNFAVTLPAPSQVQFLAATIINIGTGTLTVTGTVSGVANPTLAQWKSMTIQSNGTIWFKIAAV